MSATQRDFYRILAAHQLQYGPKVGQICSCGHAPTPLRDPKSLLTQQDIHRGHVATILAEHIQINESLARGMAQAAAGEVHDLGSFAGYGEGGESA